MVAMAPSEAFESFRSNLIGSRISHVWRGYGSAISIEIGNLTPIVNKMGRPLQPEGTMSLWVEWSWRIEDDNSILCGSWSEEELWEPALERFKEAQITSCELFGALPEIALTVDSGLRFLSFSTTDGQPQWHFIDKRTETTRWFSVRDGKLHLGDGTEPVY